MTSLIRFCAPGPEEYGHVFQTYRKIARTANPYAQRIATFDYDVAISFAGEDRPLARRLADNLTKRDVTVFYDDYEQARLMGKNLFEYLADIYTNRARFCVVLVSSHYKRERWTRHEWRAAQARALEQPDGDYILPVRLDDTNLAGLSTTTGYVRAKGMSAPRLAELIFTKIKDRSALDGAIREAERLYAAGEFEQALRCLSSSDLDREVEARRIRADSYGQLSDYRQAIMELKALEAMRPRDFLSHLLLGIFNFRMEEFDESVKHFEIADRISPGHPTILSDLPLARSHAKRHDPR